MPPKAEHGSIPFRRHFHSTPVVAKTDAIFRPLGRSNARGEPLFGHPKVANEYTMNQLRDLRIQFDAPSDRAW